MAPKFWDIKRKESPFILAPRPGPYAKTKCYSAGVLIRDVLNLCSNMTEAKRILNSGQIKVDGKTRRDGRFGVGIMDIVEIVPSGIAYRMVPKGSKLLVPSQTTEKTLKLLKITSKVSSRGNKIQYGFHDGKSLLSENKDMNVGDSCLVTIPSINIEQHIKFENGCSILVVQGENAGKIGKVEEIKDGMFSLPKRVVLTLDEKTVELPVDIVMPVGIDKPVLEVLVDE
jgi:small subunit ribosomal protein S4e